MDGILMSPNYILIMSNINNNPYCELVGLFRIDKLTKAFDIMEI
jgi:hypothetical protein